MTDPVARCWSRRSLKTSSTGLPEAAQISRCLTMPNRTEWRLPGGCLRTRLHTHARSYLTSGPGRYACFRAADDFKSCTRRHNGPVSRRMSSRMADTSDCSALRVELISCSCPCMSSKKSIIKSSFCPTPLTFFACVAQTNISQGRKGRASLHFGRPVTTVTTAVLSVFGWYRARTGPPLLTVFSTFISRQRYILK